MCIRDSSSSTTVSDPREKVRDCCRKIVAFMCTQVGVGGLVVGYAVLGAIGFMNIEGTKESVEWYIVKELREDCAIDLWELTARENVFNATTWKNGAGVVLRRFQDGVSQAVKRGYDGRKVDDTWSFPAALMFSLSIFTMLGYGNMVPRTPWGKIVTVVYAVFGLSLIHI